MKVFFEKPLCKVIHFDNDVLTTSSCGCNVGGIDFGAGANSTCTGANIECSCNPNYDDPNANCCTEYE